jgi:glycosyltransferase involved in cell wall biosynthesis
MPSPISAVLITLNEAKLLSETLSRLSFCAELIVVDSGSTDGTIEIAKSKGAKVFQRTFDTFGGQKQFAVNQASHDWVLVIDADEWVSPELKPEIIKIATSGSSAFDAYRIPRRLHFMGRSFNYGRESRQKDLRLFKKAYGNFVDSKVHEQVLPFENNKSSVVGDLVGVLDHYSYPSLEHYIQKMNRYSTLGAIQMQLDGNRFLKFRSTLFPLKFLQFYFMHGNFMNGWAGFCWSWLSSFAYVLKFLKAADLERNHQ